MSSHRTEIEDAYLARVAAMSMGERVRRAEELLRWSRDFLARSIVAGAGPLSRERLAREMALRLYGADPRARTLIDELWRDGASG